MHIEFVERKNRASLELPVEIACLKLTFPRGRIVKYFRDKQYGFLKTQNGRHVFFFLPEIDLIGPKNALRVGLEVGYDVTLVGGKMRVTKLKVC
ncbi:MAG: cold shock domain-containing protein [Acidobacteria bacterium]|nr:cold shock domain-containing protein [Acidobacteriota bacterium]